MNTATLPLRPPTMLTTGDVAARLKVSQRTVTNWAQKGLLRCFKVGAVIRFAPEDIDEFLRRHYGGSAFTPRGAS